MAVNARTFQVLYILRQRALEDLRTYQSDFTDFIAQRRASAPEVYEKAYIAPSALTLILQRMTTTDGLFTFSSTDGYEFTVRGSQMADLMLHLDGCSSWFVDNYKQAVCHAVLQQRSRLGQGPAQPNDVAAIANISRDSAHRGLTACAEAGEATEHRNGRMTTYELLCAPADVDTGQLGATKFASLDNEVEALDQQADPDSIASVLADIDNDDNWPISEAPPFDVPPDDYDDLPVRLGKVLQDDGPDEEQEARTLYRKRHNLGVDVDNPDGEDLSRLGFWYNKKLEPVPASTNNYDWNAVPETIRTGLIVRAMAAGLTLTQFLDILNLTHERKVREALFEGDDRGMLVDPAVARMMEETNQVTG